VQVKLIRGCRNLNAGTILVRKKNDREWLWKPLKKFLLEPPDRERNLIDSESAQRTWWRLNGQHFPLMDLPAELRLEIYQQALGGDIYPHVGYIRGTSTRKVILGSLNENIPLHGGDNADASRLNPPNYALLRVSKEIHSDALKAGWEGTPKRFVVINSLLDIVQAATSPPTTLIIPAYTCDHATASQLRHPRVLPHIRS
jgi:hypothetical protein